MVSVNSMWCSILIHVKPTEIFNIENISIANGAWKFLIIIIIFYFNYSKNSYNVDSWDNGFQIKLAKSRKITMTV